MKRTFLLFLFMVPFYLASAQSKEEVELTYLHKVPFPHLFKAGERERLVQLCTTVIDSTIEGTVHFEKAQIGNIKSCKMTMRITSDTIRSYSVETTGHKATNRLKKQAVEIYGSVTKTNNAEGQLIMQWKEPEKDGHFIISTLTVDTRGKHGILISKIQ